MTSTQFDKLVDEQIEYIRRTLKTKQEEYATEDRLYNFNIGASISGSTPEKTCWGYMLKHLVSLYDIAHGVRNPTIQQLDEKIGDTINYLILLKAIIREKLNSQSTTCQKEGV